MPKLLHFAAQDSSGIDVDQLSQKANQGFLAFQIVTAGAQGVANMIVEDMPPVQSDDPNIQAQMQKVAAAIKDIQAKVVTAKDNAEIWLPTKDSLQSGLCAQLSSLIPSHILEFGNAYSTASDQILQLLDKAAKEQSQDQLDEALEVIQWLLQQIGGYKKELDDGSSALGDFVTRVQSDHDALVGGGDAVQTLINMDDADRDSLESNMQSLRDEIDAYHKQIVDAAAAGIGGGIFLTVIGVCLLASGVGSVASGVVIGVGVAGIATGGALTGVLEKKISDDQAEISREQATHDALIQQAIALGHLHDTVASVVGQLSAAQSALTQIATFWQTMETTLKSTATLLQAPDADLKKIFVDKLNVQAAQKDWNSLGAMAQQLIGTSVTVNVIAAPTGPRPMAALVGGTRRFTYTPGLRPSASRAA